MKNVYPFLLTVLLTAYFTSLGAQPSPKPGELVITEIMVNPEVVGDTKGEWIEVWNAADHELSLIGIIIKDSGSNKHTMSSDDGLVMPSGHYWVLARESDSNANGGLKVDYRLSNFSLGNQSDQIILTMDDGGIIDQVAYSAGWPIVSGASIELDPGKQTSMDNDSPQHWYAATQVYGQGDKGSPGRANGLSSGNGYPEGGIRINLFPNPSQGRFMLEAEFPEILSGEIRMVNLIGQDFIYRKFSERKILREIVEPAFLSPGIWFVEVVAGKYSKIERLIIE